MICSILSTLLGLLFLGLAVLLMLGAFVLAAAIIVLLWNPTNE